MCMTSLLLSPPSILSETKCNLCILRYFIFQLNSDFISNSSLNPSGLLIHPYISLGAPPPCIATLISPLNQTLAAIQVPQHHWCLSPLSPLFQSPPFKLIPVPVVRSQGLTIGERITSKVDMYPLQSIAEVFLLFLIVAATFLANLKSIRRHKLVPLVLL
jgi:hypothetical protein